MKDRSIDILLNNSGIYGKNQSLGEVDFDSWKETLLVNTMAPYKIAEVFAPHVEKSEKKIIAILTSRMGSIDDNTSGGNYIYRSSKAAVNMVGKSLSLDLKNRGIVVVLLHPGWVKTDMGGAHAPLNSPESIEGMKKVLESLSLEDSGKFFCYDGTLLPW